MFEDNFLAGIWIFFSFFPEPTTDKVLVSTYTIPNSTTNKNFDPAQSNSYSRKRLRSITQPFSHSSKQTRRHPHASRGPASAYLPKTSTPSVVHNQDS